MFLAGGGGGVSGELLIFLLHHGKHVCLFANIFKHLSLHKNIVFTNKRNSITLKSNFTKYVTIFCHKVISDKLVNYTYHGRKEKNVQKEYKE